MKRTCVGCRQVAVPDELVRVVRTPEGKLTIGRTLPGRGAWVHPGCVAEAERRGAFSRAFRAPVSRTTVAELSKAIAAVWEDGELRKRKD